jgi:neutral trehalase
MSTLFEAMAERQTTTNASHIPQQALAQVLGLYESSRYILYTDRNSTRDAPRFNIILKKGAEPIDLLIAWWQALFEAQGGSPDSSQNESFATQLERFEQSFRRAQELFAGYEKGMRAAGWDLENGALETNASTRVVLEKS